jgi:ABC-type bacteriocin/lantibiotic exporter with double-glycine peptidase domain
VTAPAREPIQDARDWERLVPGSAAQLRAEHSAQLKHNQRVETAQVVFQYFGPILGAVVVLVSLFTGVWLINNSHTTEGALIATIDLVGFFVVLTALLIGLRNR